MTLSSPSLKYAPKYVDTADFFFILYIILVKNLINYYIHTLIINKCILLFRISEHHN